ncbi:MAG: DUF2267 domain-containing protein [Oculatellaceae cyanobacterium bins.114]|nr:DUF2267 domain-containing protein [Oculatellaceae cyanobacterium bins.114]
MTGLDVFDKTTQQTQLWINDVAAELGWDDPHKTFQVLRATLHVLRDRLTIGEAAHFGAELPILLAGFYYEGWKPEHNPTKERTKAAFLESLHNHLHHYFQTGESEFDVDVEQVARAVFKVIAERIPNGEVEDVTSILPAALKDLFPKAVRA